MLLQRALRSPSGLLPSHARTKRVLHAHSRGVSSSLLGATAPSLGQTSRTAAPMMRSSTFLRNTIVRPSTQPFARSIRHRSSGSSANAPQSGGRLPLKAILWFGGFGALAAVWYSSALKRSRNGTTCTSLELNIMRQLPTRWCSRLWGAVHQIDLPVSLRLRLFRLWADVFDCNLEEMRLPLESYKNLQEFFVRRLKEGTRPMANTPLVSPVDARVLHCGDVQDGQIEQVKGIDFPISDLCGVASSDVAPGRKLFYCTLYLSPGDYHRIHSPTQFTIHARRHHPGYLFPVAPVVCSFIPSLFALNERVAVVGEWNKGFFSLTLVGAYNVGSIGLEFDQDLETNISGDQLNTWHVKKFGHGLCLDKGSPLGVFNLGSTVVLVWEDDESFEFTISNGETVRVGQSLGDHSAA